MNNNLPHKNWKMNSVPGILNLQHFRKFGVTNPVMSKIFKIWAGWVSQWLSVYIYIYIYISPTGLLTGAHVSQHSVWLERRSLPGCLVLYILRFVGSWFIDDKRHTARKYFPVVWMSHINICNSHVTKRTEVIPKTHQSYVSHWEREREKLSTYFSWTMSKLTMMTNESFYLTIYYKYAILVDCNIACLLTVLS